MDTNRTLLPAMNKQLIGRRNWTHLRPELFFNFNGEIRATRPNYKVANDPRVLSIHKGVPTATGTLTSIPGRSNPEQFFAERANNRF